MDDHGKVRRIDCRICKAVNILPLHNEPKLICNHCLDTLYIEDVVIEDHLRFIEHAIARCKAGKPIGYGEL